MVVGFYVHENMNFVATERKDRAEIERSATFEVDVDAGAIAGAYEE